MSRRFELVVFDWDGTLMDSTAVIVASLQAACADVGLPVPSDERSHHIIGLGLYDAMAHVLPGVSTDVYPQVVERYGHHFRTREPQSPLFDGTESMLQELRGAGHRLGIATGKSRRGLDRVLEKTGLAPLFDATRCGEESASKPAPGMLLDLMRTLKTTPEKTLMIGDTTHDLQMAANAGVSGIAVTYGAHPREQLLALQPLACIDRPQDLWQWLRLKRVICASAALTDGGPGVRFKTQVAGKEAAAFVIRYDGRVYGYLNSCAHIPVELDWMEGEFFDKAGLYLVCATHGATYEPATGHCIMGPCKGSHLVAAQVEERDGSVYLIEPDAT